MRFANVHKKISNGIALGIKYFEETNVPKYNRRVYPQKCMYLNIVYYCQILKKNSTMLLNKGSKTMFIIVLTRIFIVATIIYIVFIKIVVKDERWILEKHIIIISPANFIWMF